MKNSFDLTTHLASIYQKHAPWGAMFGKRKNFEWGYLTTERYLVEKYLKSPNNVLILGSGNGREAYPIHHHQCNIICIDIGFLYLQSGNKLVAEKNIGNVHFVQADMEHLPLKKEVFDFIFFSCYSFAAERRLDILKGLRHTLMPGGLILLGAVTSFHRKKNQNQLYFENIDQLQKDISPCGVQLIEGSVDPDRPEYMMAILEFS